LLFILLALLCTLLAELSFVLFSLLEELCFFRGFIFGLLLLLTFLTHLGLLIIDEEVVAFGLLLLVLARVLLVDTGTEVDGITSEGDVHKLQEFIHSGDHTLGSSTESVLGWDSIEQDDLVSHVGGHDEIVLNNEGSTLGRHNPSLHDLGGNDTLFGVEIGTWLINEINIAALS